MELERDPGSPDGPCWGQAAVSLSETAHIMQGLWNAVLIASSDPFSGTSVGLSFLAGIMKMEMEAVGLNDNIDGKHLAPCLAYYKPP